MIRGIIIGVLLTAAVLLAGGYFGVERGLMPANADAKPSRLETWAAKASLRATIAREAPKRPTKRRPNSVNTASKTIPTAKRIGRSATGFD